MIIERRGLFRLWFGVCTGLVLLSGCDRNARLAGRELRDVTVQTVTHYGVELDKEATPEQVAYVALRAIRDDFLATNEAEHDAALDVQFDVVAANALPSWDDAGFTRVETLFMVVHNWTPTVSHYVNDFETEWEKARARLVKSGPRPAKGGDGQKSECQVLMEVQDPSGDPNATTILIVWLIEDQGYWRVLRVGFMPERRSLVVRRPASTESPSQ